MAKVISYEYLRSLLADLPVEAGHPVMVNGKWDAVDPKTDVEKYLASVRLSLPSTLRLEYTLKGSAVSWTLRYTSMARRFEIDTLKRILRNRDPEMYRWAAPVLKTDIKAIYYGVNSPKRVVR